MINTDKLALAIEGAFNVNLEDNDEINISVDTTDGLVGDATPEAAIVEVQEADMELEEEQNVIDEVDEEIEATESLSIVLESISQNGTLSEDGAMLLHNQLQRTTKKFGLESYEVIPSVENITGNAYQLSIANEGIKETVKNLIKKLVTMVKGLGRKIREFLAKLFDGAKKQQERAKKIAEAAGKIKTDSTVKTKAHGVVSKIQIDGTVPGAAEVVKRYKDFADGIVVSSKSLIENPVDEATLKAQLASVNKGSADDIKSASKEMAVGFVENSGKTLKEVVGKFFTVDVNEANAPTGVVIKRTTKYFGEQVLQTGMYTGANDAINLNDISAIARAQTITSKKIAPKNNPKNTEINVLSSSQIVEIAKQAESLMKSVSEYRKANEKRVKDTETYIEQIGKLVEKTANQLSEEDAKKYGSILNNAMRAVSSSANSTLASIRNINSLAVTMTSSVLTLAAVSLQVHEKAEGGDKDDD